MTLDGKIATSGGESKWITGPAARAVGHRLRWGVEAVMVGVETVLADDPQLVYRQGGEGEGRVPEGRVWLRVIVDSRARTPLGSRVVTDGWRERTVVVVTDLAPRVRVKALEGRVRVLQAPAGADGRVEPGWLMRWLGEVPVTSVLVESGGELGGSLVRGGWVQEVAFFYAPMVLGGASARKAVAGEGGLSWDDVSRLTDLRWRRCGGDLWLGARLVRDRGGRG
jgi:diaminohydroxyphosphoribosylaminopyrimidine deaminase/5-amino-6-(5-phosphoribosylamino)uracil reductase